MKRFPSHKIKYPTNDNHMFEFYIMYKDEIWLQYFKIDIFNKKLIEYKNNPNAGDKLILGITTDPEPNYDSVSRWISNYKLGPDYYETYHSLFMHCYSRKTIRNSQISFKLISVPTDWYEPKR